MAKKKWTLGELQDLLKSKLEESGTSDWWGTKPKGRQRTTTIGAIMIPPRATPAEKSDFTSDNPNTTTNLSKGWTLEHLRRDLQRRFEGYGIPVSWGTRGDENRTNGSNIADSPDYANVLFLAGFDFLESEQSEEAIRYFNCAIILDNSYTDAYLYRGNAFCRLNLHEKALEDFNTAINLNPGNPYPHFYKGTCLTWTYKNYKDAVKCYDEAIRLSPSNDLFVSSRKEVLDELH
jgi:tetratricopeptide (TPR) repeat protein